MRAVDDHCTGTAAVNQPCPELLPVSPRRGNASRHRTILIHGYHHNRRPSWGGVDLDGLIPIRALNRSGSKGVDSSLASGHKHSAERSVGLQYAVGQTVGRHLKAPVVELQSSFFHAGGFAASTSRGQQIIEVAAAVNDISSLLMMVEKHGLRRYPLEYPSAPWCVFTKRVHDQHI